MKSVRTWLAVVVALLMVVSASAVVAPCGPDKKSDAPNAASQTLGEAPVFEDLPVTAQTPSTLKLTGRVLDPMGRPVKDAQVSLAASAQSTISTVSCSRCGELLLSCDARESSATISSLLHGGKGFARAGATTTTDEEGRFSFDGVSGVSFSVWARATGLGAAVKERAAPGEPVELFLPPLRTIVGTVLDEHGKPVAGSHVHAVSKRLPLSAEAKAHPDGRFELSGLGEGPFYVLAEAPGHLPSVLDGVEAGPEPLHLRLSPPRVLNVRVRLDGQPVDAKVELCGDHLRREAVADQGLASFKDLFPSELTLSASANGKASAPRLVALSDAVTEVTLDLDAGGQVMITVVDEHGQPVPSPTVTLANGRHELLLEKKVGTGELVVFGPIALGDYLVEAEAEGFKAGSTPVKLSGGEANVEIVLERGTVIRGRVIDEYERPAPNVSVLVNPTGATVYSDRDGAFTVQVPTAGLYSLHAHHSDWGGGSVQVQAPADDVRLSLEPRGGVQVTVESKGRRVEAAEVVMWLEKNDVFRSDRPSGPDGIVMMRGLPQGSYWMMATHDEHLPSERQRVEIVDGSLLKLTVQLRDGAKLSGEVVDETGAPIQGAFVVAMPRLSEPAYSDGSGKFTFRAVRPGVQYRLEARHPAHEQVERVAATGGGDPVTIKMKRKKLFRGHVLAEDGGPLKRFRVDDRDFDSVDGSFEVPMLELDGRVIFSVEAQGFEPQTFERPAAPDLGDVVLKRAERFSGVVRDVSGQPVQDAVVSCDMCDETVLTGAEGRFSMSKPGVVVEYVLSARKGALTGAVEVSGPRTLPVEITLKPSTRVTGTVYLANGAPAAGEEIEALSFERNESIAFVTGPAGQYSVELPQGHYRFAVGDEQSFTGAANVLAAITGDAQRLDLGAYPGSAAVTFKLTHEQGFALWVVRGQVSLTANMAAQLKDASWAQMLYQPRGSTTTLTGFAPGRYTVVWGHFYNQDDGIAPRVLYVDVPQQREVDLTVPR